MIGNYAQEDQFIFHQQQNPLVISARGQVNILMEEINEADRILQSRQVKQQLKTALATNDIQVVNRLLQASEAHNQKMKDLIEIMKGNYTTEINRNYQLQLSMEVLTKDLNQKNLYVHQLKNDVNQWIQKECTYIERITQLEDNLNSLKQNNQQNQLTPQNINIDFQGNNNEFTQSTNNYNVQNSIQQQKLLIPSVDFTSAYRQHEINFDNSVNNFDQQKGIYSQIGMQSNINSAITTPTASCKNSNSNFHINQNKQTQINGQIQNNTLYMPVQQQISNMKFQKIDSNDSQNLISIDSQTHLSTWNKTQIVNPSSTQTITLAFEKDENSIQQNIICAKSNQVSNFHTNSNRGQSFLSHGSQQQQQMGSLQNSNILTNSRTFNQNSNLQQSINSQILNQYSNDQSNQSLGTISQKSKVDLVLHRENTIGYQGIQGRKESIKQISNSQNSHNNNNALCTNKSILQNYNNQQTQSNSISQNSNRSNQKSFKNQIDVRSKQQPLSNRFKENTSLSKTPKKNNTQNYQSQVCTINLREGQNQNTISTYNNHTNNNDNTQKNDNTQINSISSQISIGASTYQTTPIRQSKQLNKQVSQNSGTSPLNNAQQTYSSSQINQSQQAQIQMNKQISQGLTRNQSQISNLLNDLQNNAEECSQNQRSLSQNSFINNQLNLSNNDNKHKDSNIVQIDQSQLNILNKESQISPILVSIQNYQLQQIQQQKEMLQKNSSKVTPTITQTVNKKNNSVCIQQQYPHEQQYYNRQQNFNSSQNYFEQQNLNEQQLNNQNKNFGNQRSVTPNVSHSTSTISNNTLTPKTSSKNLIKIKGMKQNLSPTLNQDILIKQSDVQQQQQNSGQKNRAQSQNVYNQSINHSQFQGDNPRQINIQSYTSVVPQLQDRDFNQQYGQIMQSKTQNTQNSNSYTQKNTEEIPPISLQQNNLRSTSSDRNLVAQSVQGVNLSGFNNNIDQLSISNHRTKNSQSISIQQNQSKYSMLEGSTHSNQTTPQQQKSNLLNRPKDSFFQQNNESKLTQNNNSQTLHKRNLTPTLQNYSSTNSKHTRFTSSTSNVAYQNQIVINSAEVTPSSSINNIFSQFQQQIDGDDRNPQYNQASKYSQNFEQQLQEGEQILETSPRIKSKTDNQYVKSNYSNTMNNLTACHSKPYSHSQLQQPQSHQETIETMQSQQHFCAYSEENALFSHRNYNFSNIIKTISTNSNNKNNNQKDKIQFDNQFLKSNDLDKHVLNSQSKNKKSIQDIYFNNLQNSEKNHKYPEGDHDTKMSCQESMSIMSSSLIVNNEHSLIYEKVYGDNQDDATSNPLSDQHQLLTKYSNINLKIKDFSSKKSVLFSKDTPQAQSNYIPSKFFEEFFITGPSNQDIQECLKEIQSKSSMNLSNDKNMTTEAKVLYHFRNPHNISSNQNDRSQCYQSQNKIINEFTFPHGCQVKQLKMTNSFSSLNEILFANNSPEQGSSSVSCFVLAFRQGSDAVQVSHQGTNVNSSTQIHQSFPVYYSRVLQLLEKVNPCKTLYCICFKVKDFIESTKLENLTSSQNNINSLQRSYSTSNISKSKMKFWQTEKVFCFVTYFPFVKFFLQIITNLLNTIKIKRIKTYNERLDSIPNTLSNIDSDFLINQFIQISEKTLFELAQKDLPDFNSIMEISIQNERIQSKIPNAISANRLETEWGIYKALQQFDINNFLFLFISLLLEHSLIFVSKNITLLTSTLMVFSSSLIKPLKWVNPMIFNLPQKLIPILDSPVPILVGINKDLSFIQNQKIDTEFNNCLFIQLGNNFKVLNAKIVQNITLEIFNDIKEKVEPIFKKIQSHSLKGAPLQEHEEIEIKEDCFSLIDALSSYLQNEILNKMPSSPIYSQNQPQLLDYEQITNQTIQNVGKHRTFIKNLFKTQMISYYMEEKYKKPAILTNQ